MVRLTSPFLVIGLALAAGCGGTTWSSRATSSAPVSATPLQGWVSYRHSSGLTLQHPATWTVEASQLGLLFVFIDSRPDRAGFRRNVNVLSQTLPAGFTSDDYLRLTSSQMAKLGATLDESREATLGGLLGHGMTWHLNKAGKTIRFLEVWALRTQTAYLATYTSDSQEFDAPLADVRRLIASIRLPPSP